MRNILLIISVAVFVSSCGNKDNKTKENQTNKEQAVSGTDTSGSKTVMTKRLRFDGYHVSSKGFPHLEFKDIDSLSYDFEYPDENNFEDIPLVLKNEADTTGYVQNDELIREWFIVTIVEKMANTSDNITGEPKRSMMWRIGNIKRDAQILKLIFNGYEEGDYPHLLFKDVTTGKEYDFGHPDENDLGDIPIVQKSDKASFGYIQNGKLLGDQFMVTITYKMADTYDESGQPVKAERWRITNLRRND
jgi:hypothetical protein